MKNKYIFFIAPLVAFVLYMTLSSSSGGITGLSVTGCGGGSCHGTASSSTTAIIVTGLPAGGYVNGAVYSLTLTISNTTITPAGSGLRDGFDMKATLGSFTAITGTALNGATEIRHSTPKAAPTGTTSWTFNWTAPASGSSTITFNVAGNACNVDGNATLLDKWRTFTTTLVKAPLSVTATSSAITCNGGVSTITATGASGSTPYQYKLNTGLYQTSNTFVGNLAGTYTVTVKDALNVTATTAVTISQPALIAFNVPSITTPLCNGGTGNMTMAATGGTGTKIYSITPLGPQTNTTGIFSGLTSQTYTVTVTDANSCTKTSTVLISQPSLISFSAPVINNPLCNGGLGSVAIPASGGTGLLTYSISPLGPQTNNTGNFINLTPQTYTVTVTDANSCTKTSTVLISQPSLISFPAPVINNPLCNGGLGSISIPASGGTGLLTYSISPLGPQTNNTGNFTNLTPQTYTITVSDANSCTKTSTVLISQPSLISFSAPVINNPLCNGGLGSVTIPASGGTGLLAYSISPLGPQTNNTGNFINLTPQTYTVTVTDANSCTKTSTVLISQPSLISFSAPVINNPLCNGGLGSVSIPASGGTGLLTYSISPLGPQANNTGNFSSLTAQTYTVTVSDANNCTKTSTFTIVAPTAIAFIAPAITNPVCNGGTNGAVQIIASGGTGVKFYSITPLGPQTNVTGTFNALSAQNYTITVIDANSCTLTTTVTLTQPAPLVVTSSNVSGCQGSPIALIGTPSGGTFSVTNPYTGPSTTYTYTFTNGLGCSTTSSPSSITVTPVNSSNIVTTGSGSFCETLTQITGTNIYSNTSCQLITSIAASGLGSTNACVNFLSGTPSWNGEPYANRVYSITPTVQPATTATVCLYYTNTDLAAAGITNNADISITKVGGNGVLGGSGAVTEITNSSMTINNLAGGIREVCFPVSSFSSFYLHSKNPNNIPLPVILSDFKVEPSGNTDLLTWKTLSEMNNDYFNVQYSNDGLQFENIGTLASQSKNGYSAEELNYQFINLNTGSGIHYYRLEQVDIDGKSNYSEIISVNRTEESGLVQIFPNPTAGEFTIDSKLPVDISITDMNGREVYGKENCTHIELNLANTGLYIIRLTDSQGQQSFRKLIVR